MVIGLIGKKGSGKSTVADEICRQYPQFKQIAFADVLRDKLSEIMGIDVDDFDELKRNHNVNWGDNSVDGRHFYREIGMLMVDLAPKLFINYVENFIENNVNVIVTDVRRINEVLMLDGYKSKFINVLADSDVDNHITETLPYKLSGFMLDNSQKDMETLKQQVKEFMNDFN